jgi:hypothetical protein
MAETPPTSPSSMAVFQLRRRGLLALTFVLITPWVILVWLVFNRLPENPNISSPPPSPKAQSLKSPLPDDTLVISKGSWGQLETNSVLIEPPASLLNLASIPSIATFWYFDTTDSDTVARLFESVDLDSTQRQTLLNREAWRIESDGIEVPITKSLALSLSVDARRQIYGKLARFRGKNSQLITFGFRGEIAEWFAQSEISQSTLERVKPLIYQQGTSLQFSDLPLVIDDIPTMRERLALVRALARTRTQMARIRIMPDSDHLSLAKYWSTGRDPSRIESLLNSVPRIDGGYPLDIIHLLPNFARRLLYTYPELLAPEQVAIRDCHWTSLNFIKPEIDDSLASMTEVQRQYQIGYYHTSEPPHFGDILLFVQPDGTVLHSCVHIADSLVFTKNGTSLANPWILMQLPDVMALYPSETKVDLQVLRARD